MAKVTYRGVAYDTNDKKQIETVVKPLTHRGVRYHKVAEVIK